LLNFIQYRDAMQGSVAAYIDTVSSAHARWPGRTEAAFLFVTRRRRRRSERLRILAFDPFGRSVFPDISWDWPPAERNRFAKG